MRRQGEYKQPGPLPAQAGNQHMIKKMIRSTQHNQRIRLTRLSCAGWPRAMNRPLLAALSRLPSSASSHTSHVSYSLQGAPHKSKEVRREVQPLRHTHLLHAPWFSS